MKYLMVCLGNICRSPMAEGVLRKKLQAAGSTSEVDSCGFEPYHIGDSPDLRAQTILKNHGIDISRHLGRLFQPDDFEKFDRIFVMDSNNYRDVMFMARKPEDKEKVDYLMNMVNHGANQIVPDPYYGGIEGFEQSFNLISLACDAIIEKIEP